MADKASATAEKTKVPVLPVHFAKKPAHKGFLGRESLIAAICEIEADQNRPFINVRAPPERGRAERTLKTLFGTHLSVREANPSQSMSQGEVDRICAEFEGATEKKK